MKKMHLTGEDALIFVTETGWLAKMQSLMDFALVNRPDGEEVAAVVYQRVHCQPIQAKAVIVLDEGMNWAAFVLYEIKPEEEQEANDLQAMTISCLRDQTVSHIDISTEDL